MTKGQCGIRSEEIFEKIVHTASTRLSADPLNLKKKRAKKEIRTNSFGLRVVDPWNKLPAELKRVETVQAFKTGLKKIKH